jgi:hypothetical protein
LFEAAWAEEGKKVKEERRKNKNSHDLRAMAVFILC